MIMMVINKNKLKKIIIGIIMTLLVLSGIVFLLNRTTEKATFNPITATQVPYDRGTKNNSGHVALICNVDLGWENEYVEEILKVLQKENVKITFNVTGRWAEKNTALLLDIKKQGHEIGNHGHRHLDYANLSYEENLEQIKISKTIIENITKEPTKFFQAPSGSFGQNTIKAANELGYTSIKWDIDTIDWKNKKEPEVIIERVKKKNIKENSIVLMHPTYATSQCIDDIINIIKEKNLKPGKLGDIF